MWLGLYYKCKISSNKNLNNILEDLERIIEIDKKSTVTKTYENIFKPFSGTLTNKGFSIHRNYPIKNSFRPYIKGSFNIKENEDNLDIEIIFFINKFVMVILIIIFFTLQFSVQTIDLLLLTILILLIFNIEVYFNKKELERHLTISKTI